MRDGELLLVLLREMAASQDGRSTVGEDAWNGGARNSGVAITWNCWRTLVSPNGMDASSRESRMPDMISSRPWTRTRSA